MTSLAHRFVGCGVVSRGVVARAARVRRIAKGAGWRWVVVGGGGCWWVGGGGGGWVPRVGHDAPRASAALHKVLGDGVGDGVGDWWAVGGGWEVGRGGWWWLVGLVVGTGGGWLGWIIQSNWMIVIQSFSSGLSGNLLRTVLGVVSAWRAGGCRYAENGVQHILLLFVYSRQKKPCAPFWALSIFGASGQQICR